jgi:hypothetical protein
MKPCSHNESLDTFGGTQTLPLRVEKIQMPLSIKPEGIRLSLRPELRPRAQPKSKPRLLALSEVEWVDFIVVFLEELKDS